MSLGELLTAPAVDLARRIREGEVTPTEVLDAHIERIERVNPYINAVVQKVYDDARAGARQAEARLARRRGQNGELPPFLGVPCTIKEHIKVTGLPQTGGLVKRRHAIAREDGILVKRMRDAGFIVMGTTNVPEGLMWYESYNKIYGRTTNAASIYHTAGGSSGGEGAIIGAGGSPIGIGGDIGGSIRLPAFFNGVAGHKATGGRVPETGAWPGVSGMIARYKVCGPLARSVRDLAAVMPLLAGPDGADLSVDGPDWGEAPRYAPADIRVYWYDHNGIMPPSADVRQAIREAADALSDMGFRVEHWRPRGLERGFEMWASALEQAEGHTFNQTLGNFEPLPLLRQWLKWPLRRSDHIFPSLMLATLERIWSRFPSYGRKMADLRIALRDEIERKLGATGVLLCPVFHRTAPRHRVEAAVHFLGFVYSGMFNPLELPCTAVPTGVGKTGLPVGVQVAGVRNNDHLTLYVAEMIEEALGGWRPLPIRGTPV